jgi:predicted RNA methylase
MELKVNFICSCGVYVTMNAPFGTQLEKKIPTEFLNLIIKFRVKRIHKTTLGTLPNSAHTAFIIRKHEILYGQQLSNLFFSPPVISNKLPVNQG